MALSNAERQKRHRERAKAALRNGDTYAADLQSACTAYIEADTSDDVPAPSRLDFLLAMSAGEAYAWDHAGPVIARMLGVPEDPWPGLTGNDIARMTKGRTQEAARRNIRHIGGPSELDFTQKLIAAINAEWLKNPPSRKPPRKPVT